MKENFLFPEFLVSCCQYLPLQEYVYRTNGWCEWNMASRRFLLGLSYLHFEYGYITCTVKLSLLKMSKIQSANLVLVQFQAILWSRVVCLSLTFYIFWLLLCNCWLEFTKIFTWNKIWRSWYDVVHDMTLFMIWRCSWYDVVHDMTLFMIWRCSWYDVVHDMTLFMIWRCSWYDVVHDMTLFMIWCCSWYDVVHDMTLSMIWCCSWYDVVHDIDVAHDMTLFMIWCCSWYDVVHDMTLFMIWCCSWYDVVHDMTLFMIWHCSLVYSGHNHMHSIAKHFPLTLPTTSWLHVHVFRVKYLLIEPALYTWMLPQCLHLDVLTSLIRQSGTPQCDSR